MFTLLMEVSDVNRCPWCGQILVTHWVHGQVQCLACRSSLESCCADGACERALDAPAQTVPRVRFGPRRDGADWEPRPAGLTGRVAFQTG